MTIHEYQASVRWSGSTAVGYDAYVRTHDGDASPAAVRLSLGGDPAFGGNAAFLNPEQLVVLAAASCQLLSFLAVAARARIDVVDYADDAAAVMPEDDRPTRITAITLRPRISIASGPTLERVTHLIGVAHRECYIANTLRSEITIEPTISWV